MLLPHRLRISGQSMRLHSLKMNRSTDWSEQRWQALESETRKLALQTASEAEAWRLIVRRARYVMRSFTTSFFIVTRFLPVAKREQVEAVYAAVRYPDEIVDTLPL